MAGVEPWNESSRRDGDIIIRAPNLNSHSISIFNQINSYEKMV